MALHLELIMYRPSLAPTTLLSATRLEAAPALDSGRGSVVPAIRPLTSIRTEVRDKALESQVQELAGVGEVG